MRDREPTITVDTPLGPALRYAVYGENGQFVRYEYIIAADEPTNPGTPINKKTLLSDPTETALWGNAADRTVDDALGLLTSLLGPTLAIPSQNGVLTYTGGVLNPVWNSYSSDKMTMGGTTGASNAGTYTATFTPKGGFRWIDGTTTTKSVTWTISKAAGSLSINPTSLTISPGGTGTISVTRAGTGTITATSSNTALATVSVSGTTVTVKSVGTSMANVTVTVAVAAGANHDAPANKTCAVAIIPTEVVFESSGTFNPAAYGLTVGQTITVTVVGGGGGGGSGRGNYGTGGAAGRGGGTYAAHGGGGGGGGGYGGGGGGGGGVDGPGGGGGGSGYVTTKSMALTSIAAIAVTVGSGGSGSAGTAIGGAGGASSFGSYLSANGGSGGNPSASSYGYGGAGGQSGGGGISSNGGGGGGGGGYSRAIAPTKGGDSNSYTGGAGGTGGGAGGAKGSSGYDGGTGKGVVIITWTR